MKASHLLRLFAVSFLASPVALKAQYFYKDIWNLQQLNASFQIVKSEHIKAINIKSFESSGEESEGFRCQKKIKGDYSQSEMISNSNITGESLLVTDYGSDGKIVRTTDNTPTTTSETKYDYDSAGRLKTVTITTKADDDSAGIVEKREYEYDEQGSPAGMTRKKNGTVVTTIGFKKDEKGNVIEENVLSTYTTDRQYYYYYDDKNRLTDVVHFNELAGKLLPDYIYEYENSDLPTQMISASESGNNYFIWRYRYNDKKLREAEICYSKDKRLLGRVEYEYK